MIAAAEPTYLISSPVAVLTALAAITAFFFFLEHRTKWKFFAYFPPLLFVYTVPNMNLAPNMSRPTEIVGRSAAVELSDWSAADGVIEAVVNETARQDSP